MCVSFFFFLMLFVYLFVCLCFVCFLLYILDHFRTQEGKLMVHVMDEIFLMPSSLHPKHFIDKEKARGMDMFLHYYK